MNKLKSEYSTYRSKKESEIENLKESMQQKDEMLESLKRSHQQKENDLTKEIKTLKESIQIIRKESIEAKSGNSASLQFMQERQEQEQVLYEWQNVAESLRQGNYNLNNELQQVKS